MQLSLVSSPVVLWLSVVATRLLGTRLSCVLFSWVLSRVLVLVSRDLWRTTQNSSFPLRLRPKERLSSKLLPNISIRSDDPLVSQSSIYTLIHSHLFSSLVLGPGHCCLLLFYRERGIEFSFLSSASIYVITTHYFDGGLWISQILHYDYVVLLGDQKQLFGDAGVNSPGAFPFLYIILRIIRYNATFGCTISHIVSM